jgi:Xaa-Pro aminopeptidase
MPRRIPPRWLFPWLAASSGLALPAMPLSGQSDVAFPREVYAERRTRLVAHLDAPVVAPGEYMIRHGGSKKQDPDFAYLTGVESPYAVLVLAPSRDGGVREALFVGDEDIVYLTRDGGSMYAPPGMSPPLSIRRQFEASLAEILPGRRLEDASPAIHRTRLVKDDYEISALRRAAEISVEGLLEAMRRIRPGMNDLEVAGVMEWVWKREGSPRASFGPIVASGPEAVSLYTIRSENYGAVDRVMQDGELIFIDYGAAEWAMYTSDLCRTLPVSGRFTERQRDLYEAVLEAQQAAISLVHPGVMMTEIIQAAASVFRARGLDRFEDIDAMGVERVWGLMPSPAYWLDGPAEPTDYSGARGTGVRDLGHHIGLDALDSRDYSMPLEPGMVFTI